MNKPFVVIIPTRGRPGNLLKVIDAWDYTGAFKHADMMVAFDDDDPYYNQYERIVIEGQVSAVIMPEWQPLVPKLNHVAMTQAERNDREVIGFAGDDHIPRSYGWAEMYLETLLDMGTGIVYGNDLHHGKNLPTEWAMTVDIIRELGRMVPAPVDHLYCDNSILDLGTQAGCIQYLDDVHIEHMHPIWQKGEWDQQYREVNSRHQYRMDGQKYRQWRDTALTVDTVHILELKEKE